MKKLIIGKDARRMFDVMVNNKLYPVFSIESKKYEPMNCGVPTWWMFYGTLKEGQSEIDFDDFRWVEYESKVIPRNVWKVEYEERTTTKQKWGSIQFNGGGATVKIWCNGRLFYSFGCRGMDYGLSKIQYMIVQMSEHPYNFYNPEEENGRKIFFYGLPATIQPHELEKWNIYIIPDYDGITEDDWWNTYETRINEVLQPEEDKQLWGYISGSRHLGFINWGDAFSDGNINWFRK